MYLRIFNEVFFSATEAIIILLFYIILNNDKDFVKKSLTKIIVFVVLYTVFSYWVTQFTPPGIHSLIIIMFMIFSLNMMTKSSFINTFITILFVLICFLATEYFVKLLFIAWGNFNTLSIINNQYIRFEFGMLTRVLQTIIVAIGFKFEKAVLKQTKVNNKNSHFPYMLVGIVLMGTFFFSVDYVLVNKSNIILYEILLLVIFLMYLSLGYFVYKEKKELIKKEYKYKLQEQYIEHLNTVINVIRREKHDFSNHINTINALCVLNKPDDLKLERIKQYLHKLNYNLKSIYHFYNTGNDYIDGLLAVKSNEAFEKNINLDVDFEKPLDILNIESYDLVNVFENIINNAFEALDRCNKKDKAISVIGFIEGEEYNLCIANNGPKILDKHKDKIFKNGFSTKEEDKDNHGLGLYNVKKTIEKNEGSIEIYSSEIETKFAIKFKIISHESDSSKKYQTNSA